MTRSGIVRLIRVLACLLLIGGYVAYVRGNNAEATAIFDAGGDAGMWDLGIILVTALLTPGAILLLLSLAVSVRTKASAVVAVAAGAVVLAPTAWLATILLPPAKETTEGARLDLAQWNDVADMYLMASILMAGAGALLIVSAIPRRGRDWRG